MRDICAVCVPIVQCLVRDWAEFEHGICSNLGLFIQVGVLEVVEDAVVGWWSALGI